MTASESNERCPCTLVYAPPGMKPGQAVLCPRCKKAVKIALRPYMNEKRFTIERHPPKG